MNGIIGFFVGLIAIVIPGFGTTPPISFSGYVEADYLYAAGTSAGPIESFAVAEGQQVKVGDLLFTLVHNQQDALLAAAQARVASAQATAKNLATGGRSEEVDVARASLNKAQSDLALAAANLDRTTKLSDLGLAPSARLDQDRATLTSAQAQVDQLTAQVSVSELPARSEQQSAAEANLLAAQADAQKAQFDLDDRSIHATRNGVVDRLFYQVGEMAAAGAPVLALLPDDGLKVKFYVGETQRSTLTMGEQVAVGCDGCAAGITAHISHFSADPQFSPPIIYSRDERSRLVFLVEARIDESKNLRTGQPVSIEPKP